LLANPTLDPARFGEVFSSVTSAIGGDPVENRVSNLNNLLRYIPLIESVSPEMQKTLRPIVSEMIGTPESYGANEADVRQNALLQPFLGSAWGSFEPKLPTSDRTPVVDLTTQSPLDMTASSGLQIDSTKTSEARRDSLLKRIGRTPTHTRLLRSLELRGYKPQ
jgi:hypothetical protein